MITVKFPRQVSPQIQLTLEIIDRYDPPPHPTEPLRGVPKFLKYEEK